MADTGNTVRLNINVTDATSGVVIGQLIRLLGQLGTSGTTAGTMLGTAGAKGAAGIRLVSSAGVTVGNSLTESMTTAVGAIGTLVPAANQAQQAIGAIGTTAAQAAINVTRASGEMQQMALSMERAQQKMGAPKVQTDRWQGPMRQKSADLADSFAGLGTAKGEMAQLGDQFAMMPAKAAAAEAAAGKFGKGLAGHTTTGLDRVRLLGQELGIRIPRAMENAIARSKVLSGAIGSIGPLLLGLGYVGVFVQLADQAYQFFKVLREGDNEVKKFDRGLSEAAKKKYFDGAQYSQSRNQFAGNDADLTKLDRKNDNSLTYTQKALYFFSGNKEMQDKATHSQHMSDEEIAQRNTAREIANTEPIKIEEERHKSRMANLDAEAARAGAMRAGAAKDSAEHANALRKAEEDHVNRVNQQNAQIRISNGTRKPGDKGYLPEVGMKDLDPEREQARLAADEGFRAKRTEANRAESDEVRRMQHEADNSSLRGTRLLEAQRVQAYEEFTIKYGASVAARAAIDRKYAEEKKKLLDEENAETARAQADAAAGGLTGLAQIDARTASRLALIAKEAGPNNRNFSNPATRGLRDAAARQDGHAEQEKLQGSFSDRIRDMDAERSNSTMSESDRIDAQTKRTTAEITKAWTDMYGQLAAGDQRRVQSYVALQGELRRIDQAGNAEKLQVRRTLEDETRHLEDEAGRRGLTKEQQEAQAILNEYSERYRHLEELRVKDAANSDLYRRQELAAEESKNGKLLDMQREQRDKLAGILRGYMSNPLEALKRQGEESASKFAANFLLKASGRTKGPGAGTLGGENKMGDLLGMPGGIFHGAVKVPGAQTEPARAGGKAGEVLAPLVASQSSVSAASTTLTTGSAVIHIGSATFADMAGGGGAVPAAGAVMAASRAGGAGVAVPGISGGGSSPAISGAGSVGASLSGLTGGTDLLGGMGMVSSGTAGMSGINVASSAPSSTAEATGGGGFTPSGGPGIAAVRQSMGMEDAGVAPKLEAAGSMGMQKFGQANDLSKMLGGDLGAQGKAAITKITGMSDKTMGQVGGAIGGASGLFSAFESNGGLGGALTGAMGGAQLGNAVGGPIGAAIGAAGGAVIGFMGFGGAEKAKKYEKEQVRPRVQNDIQQFGQGSMDYQTAWDDLVKLDQEAKFALKQFGPGGKREWNDTVHPEIMTAQQTLTREQKAGRSQYGMTAAQFHTGGLISDFGSFGTVGDQGFIHAQKDEFMVQQQAVPSHYQALQLINSGASHGEMSDYYGSGGGGGYQPAAGGGGDVNLHFHSHDAQGAMNLFMENKHHIRAALNQSYAENSGGADA